MGPVDRRAGASVLLAAGTVGGAGTTIALRAALEALSVEGRNLEAIVPRALMDEARAWAPQARLRPFGRFMAMVSEVVGGGRADVYVGFADRLPLLRRGGRTQVLVVQNPHLYEHTAVASGVASTVKFAALRRWARHSVRQADRVVCSSSASADAVSAACGVARSGIDIRPIPPPPVGAAKIEHRDRIEHVLFVGDVYPYKRWEVALDAVVAFAGRAGRTVTVEHLGVVRDATAGQHFGEAVERAAAAGVGVVRRGAVAHDDVLAAMRGADVLILASEAESQGLPLAEALAVGLPVVARDLAVFREQAGIAAVLVSGGVAEFADALDGLDDRAERVRRSLAGRPPAGTEATDEGTTRGWRLLD